MDRFEALRGELRAFVAERDWDQFHRPKDLAVGLAVEAGELLEHFQWRDPSAEEVRAGASLVAIRDEVADCVLYAMLLADKLGFDAIEAAGAKLEKNRERYPADLARGSAAKYTERRPG